VKSAAKRKAEAVPLEEAGDLIPAAFQNVIGYHLRVAQEASFQAFSAAADKADLKPGWYSILTILTEHDALTPSELSRVCGRDRSTLTATLKALAVQGLIERERKPEDQRSYSVRLTDDGRRMQERLHEIAEQHDRHLDEIVGEDKAIVIAALGRIVAAFGGE